MFDFFKLYELAQIRAIHSAIEPSAESIYRIRCREYSQLYHTPLHVVMNELDPLIVLQALNEDKYPPSAAAGEELEDLLEILQKIKDPTYSKMSAQEVEDMIDSVLNKEIARAAKKKPPTQQTIQEDIKKAESKPTPKSGSMDFGNLESLEGPGNKGKFED